MPQKDYDAIIIGAGFAGLYMLIRLRSQGLTVRVFEAGEGLGGTWFWNRYPGARVDVESHEYSYSFSPELEDEWEWSERYAGQPELLRYLNHVADRFDLRKDIQFSTRVVAQQFDENRGLWLIRTDDGSELTSRFCIMATGCLTVATDPSFPGEEGYRGEIYHTNRWPTEGVDFSGLRVGVIGTGSSGIQTITEVAPQVAHLTIFQRTPNFSVPAHNGRPDSDRMADWRRHRSEYRERERRSFGGFLSFGENEDLTFDDSEEGRRQRLEERWQRGGFALTGAYADVLIDKQANQYVADFVAEKIRDSIQDPRTAERLIPKSYPIGAKRLCIDTGYYAIYNRENVTLVDIREQPIERIIPNGIQTSAKEYPLDAIIYATGFDAMTGALDRIDIRGRDGVKLRDSWREGPKTYLGLTVHGFPNMFIVAGPGSPSVLSNMVVSIEQHVEWISDCIAWLETRQKKTIEASAAAQEEWVEHVNEVAAASLYVEGNSWYLGANVPGKPRVFMPYAGGVGAYREQCEAIVADGYRGFDLT